MEPLNEFVSLDDTVPLSELPPLDKYFISDIPTKIITDTCGLCKKTWGSTGHLPVTTLLCGHTYHTICKMLNEYEDDNSVNCPDVTCEYPSRNIVYNIYKSRQQKIDDKVDELLEEKLQTVEFNSDLKDLKKSIHNVMSTHKKAVKVHNNAKKHVIHTHIHTINQIQHELNAAMVGVKDSDEMKGYSKALRIYRRNSRLFFDKHHVSFRDLNEARIIRVGWRVRWILERHRNGFSMWRYALKIKPGGKRWKDPIRDDEV